MIDDLKKSTSRFEVNQRLNDLPRGLECAYRLVFCRLLQSLDKYELRLAQNILAFIIVACRPLHFDEFRYAHALQCRSAEAAKRPLEDFLLVQPSQVVLEKLAGLVSKTNGLLCLTHSSVRDFLVRPKEQWIPEPDRAVVSFRIDITEAHLSFSWHCLDCLELGGSRDEQSRSDRPQCVQNLNNDCPFLGYATVYTFFHLNRAGPPCSTTLAKIESFLKSPQSVMWLEHFACLQFEDLTLSLQKTEYQEFRDQMFDAGLETRFLTIFSQTFMELTSQVRYSEENLPRVRDRSGCTLTLWQRKNLGPPAKGKATGLQTLTANLDQQSLISRKDVLDLG